MGQEKKERTMLKVGKGLGWRGSRKIGGGCRKEELMTAATLFRY